VKKIKNNMKIKIKLHKIKALKEEYYNFNLMFKIFKYNKNKIKSKKLHNNHYKFKD